VNCTVCMQSSAANDQRTACECIAGNERRGCLRCLAGPSRMRGS
jgi:hypothetical protein